MAEYENLFGPRGKAVTQTPHQQIGGLAEYDNPSKDKSNSAVQILAAMAVGAAVIGAILLLAGAQASGAASTYYGSALVGFSFMMWILLLVFWAWRWERRTHPIASSGQLTAENIAAAIRSANASTGQPVGPATADDDLAESVSTARSITDAYGIRSEPAAIVVPQGFSTHWIGGRLLAISAVGDRRYLRVQDAAGVLGLTDAALLARIPLHSLNLRAFDTRTTTFACGRTSDTFVDVVAAHQFLAGLQEPPAEALAAFAATLSEPEADTSGRPSKH